MVSGLLDAGMLVDGDSAGTLDNMDDKVEQGYLTLNGCAQTPSWVEHRNRSRSTKVLSHNWMSYLEDDTLLSAMTIPGTHDSAAYTVSLPFVATQKMNIVQQLDAGIRYFDFRCGVRSNQVEMVHGATYLGLKFEDVLNDMYEWLDTHTSEALIIQIKRDRKEKKSNVDFANAIFQVLAKRSEFWRTADTTPTIGELRGRIQLFRRFVEPELHEYGIDVSEWQDNPRDPFTLYTCSGVQLTIQDHYAFPQATTLPSVIAKKGGNIAELLDRASSDNAAHNWYINFTSAFEINVLYQIPPREIAVGGWWLFRWKHGVNPRLRQTLKQAQGQRRRLGVVAMDFPEQGAEDLVSALYMTNFDSGSGYTTSRWLILLTIMLVLSSLVAIYEQQHIRQLYTG